MAIELFLMPSTGTGTRDDPYRLKYSDEPGVIRSGSIRYQENDVVVAMIEAPQATLDVIAGYSDATRLATENNLETTVTAGNVTTVRSIFEAAFIPNVFINVGDTRREVIRGVIGMFLFSQRMEGALGEGWKKKAQDAGVTLASKWSQFPTVLKNALITVRDDFGWSTEQLGVNNQSTMREILKAVSDQFEGNPVYISGFEI